MNEALSLIDTLAQGIQTCNFPKHVFNYSPFRVMPKKHYNLCFGKPFNRKEKPIFIVKLGGTLLTELSVQHSENVYGYIFSGK